MDKILGCVYGTGCGNPKTYLLSFAMMIAFIQNSSAQDERVIRLAKLTIDSTQLVNYRAALKEQIATALRVEPGVLTLYAVSDKNDPTQITVFEIYVNKQAYTSHLETSHFKKYKATTKDMVKSLTLTDTVPIAVDAKPNQQSR